MKEMEYLGHIPNAIILAHGFYRGYEYYILNLGTHPTAYVKLPHEHEYYYKHYNDIPIACHYGLTYSNPFLHLGNGEYHIGYFIGWDYAHLGDYYQGRHISLFNEQDKKWSTVEIFKEVKEVIKQLDGVD